MMWEKPGKGKLKAQWLDMDHKVMRVKNLRNRTVVIKIYGVKDLVHYKNESNPKIRERQVEVYTMRCKT
jgi:hypothetical protein